MATTVETIKDRLGIVDVVSTYIKLDKAGVNYKARCPFHNEKTPSFSVSPSRNSFYCFGCGAHGDVFEFVERFEGVDFMGALKILAEKANVPIVFEQQGNSQNLKDEKDRLFEVLRVANEFFVSNLEKNTLALDYLKSRGLKEETIKSFSLGYALPEWRALSTFLDAEGFSKKEIEQAGLSKEGNRGYYDRFRGRIMFPISDQSGRVVAFTGRIFDQSVEGEGVTPAKYVNSPETILYQKSKILYGFDKAKEGIRKWTFAIVVEGQMDMLMCHQSGFRNTVAISGTALTNEQLGLIKRFTERLVLSLDADDAGLNASGKSAKLALALGFDVKMAHLHGGKDPADIIKESEEAYRETIKNAKHIIEFYLNVLREKWSDQRKFRLAVTKTVLPFVLEINNAVDRAHFLEIIANKLQLPVASLEEELVKIKREEQSNVGVHNNNVIRESVFGSRLDSIVSHLVGALVVYKDKIGDEYESNLKELESLIGKEKFERYQSDDLKNEAAFKFESINNERPPYENIKELMLNLRLEVKKEFLERMKSEIGEFESRGDDSGLHGLMRDYQSTMREIGEIKQLIESSGRNLVDKT